MNRRILYVLGALAGLAILAGTAVSAFAAPPAQTPNTPQGNVGPGHGMMGWGGAFNLPAVVAKVLNLDVNAVIKDHQAGKSFAEIAQAKGVSEDTLIKGILAERKALLDQRVQAGTLTAEQAQLMLDRMDDQIKVMVERKGATGPGYGRGMMGGFGSGMPCWQGQAPPQAPNQSSAPATRGRGMMGGGLGPAWNR